ncbi:MAG: MBL fold metallo-hydrolase [Roseburia sp.]|nr:MBL fold metallo-hydrolase [Roseburia sp.]
MHKQVSEILPNTYLIHLYQGKNEINIYLIKGELGERSLLIDTGYQTPENRAILEEIFSDLRIRLTDLDVFLTHKHHDHTGIAAYLQSKGASIFMNPVEDRHPYDCLYYGQGPKAIEEQNAVLKRVGVTPERTPDVYTGYKEFNAYYQNIGKNDSFKTRYFTYSPLRIGQTFIYGNYTFRTIPLPGHTLGQMGLYDPARRILFTGDQIIPHIVPIVGTSYINEHLLSQFFHSLEEIKTTYAGYTIYPAHGEIFKDSEPIVERILSGYRKKLVATQNVLANSAEALTVQEIAFRVYGVYTLPTDVEKFFTVKSIITKTFSCLEYLYDQGYCERMEQDGMLFYR